MPNSDNDFSLKGMQLWPTMFFTRQWDQQSRLAPEILDFLQAKKREQGARIQSQIATGMKSKHGLYESDFDLFDSEHAGLQELVRFIRNSLALAVSVANNQSAKPEQIEVQFNDSWYHITNDGGFHDAHVHHGCSWCGIFFLDIGDAGRTAGAAPNGGSRFYCPFTSGGAYRDFGNQYLTSSVDAPIKNGLLLLFPSYLLHSGMPYSGNSDRVVLAFNATAHLRADAATPKHAIESGGK